MILAKEKKNTMFSSEEPPHKRRKEEEACPWRSPLDDIAIQCLTSVSRLEYANLSLVSKSYRSLIASSYLYNMRSMRGSTETNVYVCLRTPHEPQNPKWYILRRRNSVDEFNLFPIPSLSSQPPEESSVVVLDWEIYLIGGLINGNPTSNAWVLDCRTHTWRRLPSMKVARANAAIGVVDGKIYVFGGRKINIRKFSNWGEVFDPKTQTWHNLEKNQNMKIDNWDIRSSTVVDKKVYAMDGYYDFSYYSPSESEWGRDSVVEMIENKCNYLADWCMIDNILYCLESKGNIHWFEPDEFNWVGKYKVNPTKKVKGLESLTSNLSNSRLIHFNEEDVASWYQTTLKYQSQSVTLKYEDLFTGARMNSFGGNIVLFWDVIERDHLQIWCAEISLERRQDGEIWGNIEWSNVVMSIDHFIDRYKVLYSVSVTM